LRFEAPSFGFLKGHEVKDPRTLTVHHPVVCRFYRLKKKDFHEWLDFQVSVSDITILGNNHRVGGIRAFVLCGQGKHHVGRQETSLPPSIVFYLLPVCHFREE
jgi:hypothetical protein